MQCKKQAALSFFAALALAVFSACGAAPQSEKILTNPVTQSSNMTLNEPDAVSAAESALLPPPKIVDVTGDLLAVQQSNDWTVWNKKYANLALNWKYGAVEPSAESMSAEEAADIAVRIAEGLTGYNLREAEVPVLCTSLFFYQNGERPVWHASFTIPEKIEEYYGGEYPNVLVFIDAITGDLISYNGLYGHYDLMDDKPGIPEDITHEDTKRFNDILNSALPKAGLGSAQSIDWDAQYGTTAAVKTDSGAEYEITMGSIGGFIGNINNTKVMPELDTAPDDRTSLSVSGK